MRTIRRISDTVHHLGRDEPGQWRDSYFQNSFQPPPIFFRTLGRRSRRPWDGINVTSRKLDQSKISWDHIGISCHCREPLLGCRYNVVGRRTGGLGKINERPPRPTAEPNVLQCFTASEPEEVECFILISSKLLRLWLHQMPSEDGLIILCRISGCLSLRKESRGIQYVCRT